MLANFIKNSRRGFAQSTKQATSAAKINEEEEALFS